MLKCPHCGWQYNPDEFGSPGDDGRPFARVPFHTRIVTNPSAMSTAALECGASEEEVTCPGSQQHPRNLAQTDDCFPIPYPDPKDKPNG